MKNYTFLLVTVFIFTNVLEAKKNEIYDAIEHLNFAKVRQLTRRLKLSDEQIDNFIGFADQVLEDQKKSIFLSKSWPDSAKIVFGGGLIAGALYLLWDPRRPNTNKGRVLAFASGYGSGRGTDDEYASPRSLYSGFFKKPPFKKLALAAALGAIGCYTMKSGFACSYARGRVKRATEIKTYLENLLKERAAIKTEKSS